ncbi:MAG: restriction endonuclease subunit S [Polaribacter sp.]|uniref:restriction endonuclease subunit S n=1 Tax=Polaribacter sp. TaxID=1920175 RepID=UPI003BB1F1C0
MENNNRLIPKLRFKEFDTLEESYLYKRFSFDNIFLFSTGKNIKQKEASPEFETPCVRYGELYHMYNEVIFEVFNKTNLGKTELLFSKGDEILLPSAGEDPLDIGSASALTIKNVAIGRTINILRPLKENLFSQIYVSYYINQKLKKKISTLAKGSSISNVYNSDLKTLKINLPNLQEQQKIATFLTSVDTKIQQLTTKKDLLENYKKGVMQQLFPSSSSGQVQLRFKNDDGSDFSDWEEKKLGEIFKFKQGFQFPVEEQFETPFENSVYFIRIINVTSSPDDKRYVKRPEESNVLNENDLFMVRYGDAGKIVTGFNGIIANNMFRLLPKIKVFNKWFYFYLDSIYDKIHALAGSSTMPAIKFGTIENLKISTPSLKEQQKIATYLSAIDAKIEKVQIQIEKTQVFKKGLLQQLFV